MFPHLFRVGLLDLPSNPLLSSPPPSLPPLATPESSAQHMPFPTPTSIAFCFYSLFLLYPPQAVPRAQAFPDPFFYSLVLL